MLLLPYRPIVASLPPDTATTYAPVDGSRPPQTHHPDAFGAPVLCDQEPAGRARKGRCLR
jgi:hypothetical protein